MNGSTLFAGGFEVYCIAASFNLPLKNSGFVFGWFFASEYFFFLEPRKICFMAGLQDGHENWAKALTPKPCAWCRQKLRDLPWRTDREKQCNRSFLTWSSSIVCHWLCSSVYIFRTMETKWKRQLQGISKLTLLFCGENQIMPMCKALEKQFTLGYAKAGMFGITSWQLSETTRIVTISFQTQGYRWWFKYWHVACSPCALI